jgi:hypothetical protein
MTELIQILNNPSYGINTKIFDYLNINELYNLFMCFKYNYDREIFNNMLEANNITFPILESMFNIENDMVDEDYIHEMYVSINGVLDVDFLDWEQRGITWEQRETIVNNEFNLSQIKIDSSFIDLNCVAYFGHTDLLVWLMKKNDNLQLDWMVHGGQNQLHYTGNCIATESGFMKYCKNNDDKINFMVLLKKSGYLDENKLDDECIYTDINGTIIDDFILHGNFHIVEKLIEMKYFNSKHTIASLFYVGSHLCSQNFVNKELVNNDTVFKYLKILNSNYPSFFEDNPDLYIDDLIERYIWLWPENNINQIKYIIEIIQPSTQSQYTIWSTDNLLVDQGFDDGFYSLKYFIELLELGMDYEMLSLNLDTFTTMYNKYLTDNVITNALINQIMNLPKTKLASRFQNLYYEFCKNEYLMYNEIMAL